MPYITKQELNRNRWFTWILLEGFNTLMVDTTHQMTEEEATIIREQYLDTHLYDDTPKATIDIYENRSIIEDAVRFIKTTNPTLAQWNAYLNQRNWDDALAIRWFLAMLARGLATRAEVSLDAFTETEVLTKLKTWIINTPARRMEKIIFGN